MTDQEINEAVARRLGWKSKKEVWKLPVPELVETNPYPDYCHDIKAAGEIICKYPSIDGYCFYIEWLPVDQVWRAGWCRYQQFEGWVGLANSHHADIAMAICLAFLKLENDRTS
jgi:hypothetical protein